VSADGNPCYSASRTNRTYAGKCSLETRDGAGGLDERVEKEKGKSSINFIDEVCLLSGSIAANTVS